MNNYFAKLTDHNVVTAVFIVTDDNCPGETFAEKEASGESFCNSEFGPGHYLMTSKANEFRCRYAGIGMTYDETLDVFLFEKPYPSWVLNEFYYWQAPVEVPSEGGHYEWNEETKTWDEMTADDPGV
jgi:hypothetical protein